MARRFSSDKEKEKKIALEHIKELFTEAESVFKDNPELADKYVKKARDIQMKVKLRMPAEYKRKYCKHCYTYFVPSTTCRVRINGGKVVYYCLKCKNYTRIPINPKKSAIKS